MKLIGCGRDGSPLKDSLIKLQEHGLPSSQKNVILNIKIMEIEIGPNLSNALIVCVSSICVIVFWYIVSKF